MSKRSTKSPRRGAKRGKLAPVVLERHDELGIAEFFRSHGLALMPLAQFWPSARSSSTTCWLAPARRSSSGCCSCPPSRWPVPRARGARSSANVVWYGQQPGRVGLLERDVRVMRPRLRTKGRAAREVAIPAYEALRARS